MVGDRVWFRKVVSPLIILIYVRNSISPTRGHPLLGSVWSAGKSSKCILGLFPPHGATRCLATERKVTYVPHFWLVPVSEQWLAPCFNWGERCGKVHAERCQDSLWGLFAHGHCRGATSGLSLARESSGVSRLHIGCCRRRPCGVRRSSEARQASGTLLGREPRVAAGAATRGYGRVPREGTCAADVVRVEGVSVCIWTFPPAS